MVAIFESGVSAGAGRDNSGFGYTLRVLAEKLMRSTLQKERLRQKRGRLWLSGLISPAFWEMESGKC